MKSTSGGDGSYSLTVSFEVGSDPDLNTVNVTNRVNQALALAAAGGAAPGRHHQEAVLGAAAVHRLLLAQGHARRAVPVQFRHHHRAGRDQARAGRRRCRPVRPARLLDAHLAEPRPHVEPRHHGQRRGQGGAGAERAGRGRAGRRRPAGRQCRLPAQHHHPGPAGRHQAVREHRRARPARRLAGARQGHRPRRARRQEQRLGRPATTASRRPASRSTSCPAPMRWPPRTPCAS